ncbi:hypothetical protein HDU89_006311 [Geranomyces variabilis]|nr:hypothetical protein HDU89_006311 [Geranomyces variabilis]
MASEFDLFERTAFEDSIQRVIGITNAIRPQWLEKVPRVVRPPAPTILPVLTKAQVFAHYGTPRAGIIDLRGGISVKNMASGNKYYPVRHLASIVVIVSIYGDDANMPVLAKDSPWTWIFGASNVHSALERALLTIGKGAQRRVYLPKLVFHHRKDLGCIWEPSVSATLEINNMATRQSAHSLACRACELGHLVY